MTAAQRLPGWLGPANRVVMALQRLGVVIGTQRVLSVPGRHSGRLRSTPVSLLTLDGERYLCSVGDVQRVLNARPARWGYLARGRARERVALVEVPVEQRGRVLREFPGQVPHGVQFFVQVGIVSGPDPDDFAAAASDCAVFRPEGGRPVSRPVSRPPAPGAGPGLR